MTFYNNLIITCLPEISDKTELEHHELGISSSKRFSLFVRGLKGSIIIISYDLQFQRLKM